MQVAPVGPRIRGGLPESTEMWSSLIVFAVQKTRNKDFWWDIQILGVYIYIMILAQEFVVPNGTKLQAGWTLTTKPKDTIADDADEIWNNSCEPLKWFMILEPKLLEISERSAV